MHPSIHRTILSACLVALFSLGCDEDGTDPNPAPTTGAIRVTTVTTGPDQDPDGYTVTVDGGTDRAIGTSASILTVGLSAGTHTVVLGALASNCSVSGSATTSVTVTVGDTAAVSFAVACTAIPAPTGAISVTTTTTGNDVDPDGYTVDLDGGPAQPIGINGTHDFATVIVGSHTVTLGSLASNCTVTGTASQAVTVTAGNTASVDFDVTCTTIPTPTGTIAVTATTTGTDLDANGYFIALDGGPDQAIGINGSLDLTSIDVGSHTVALSGAALNCTSAGGFTQTVNVTSGVSVAADFVLTCGSAPTGTIVFSTDRDGQMEVYSIKPDGTGATRLTTAGQIDWYPSLSEDGSKIVFESNRDGNFEVYSMTSDGGSQVNLTNDPGVDWYPTWSPDGTEVVFASTRNGGHLEIYIMNEDGSGVTQLTNGTDESLEPQWSPDGTTILFTRRTPAAGGGAAGPSKLWTMNADGTGQAPLLPASTSSDEAPEYSPDGLQIVFISDRDGNDEVYLVNSDGTGVTRLTNTPTAHEQVPSFEPLGRYIVFDTDRDGNIELYTMNADGTNPTRFTNNPAQDFAADWKP